MKPDGSGTAIEYPRMEVELKSQPRCLTPTELSDYAKATGKSVVLLKGLSARAALGHFMRRIGAARVGHAMLVEGEDHIKTIMEECDEMMEEFSGNPDAAAVAIKAKLGAAELWVKMAQTHIDSEKRVMAEESDERPQNKPPPPLVAVQNNHYHNGLPSEKPVGYVEEDKNKAA